jgi:hypothetical protein
VRPGGLWDRNYRCVPLSRECRVILPSDEGYRTRRRPITAAHGPVRIHSLITCLFLNSAICKRGIDLRRVGILWRTDTVYSISCFIHLGGLCLSGRGAVCLRGHVPHTTESPATLIQRSQARTNFVSSNLHLNRACNVPCLLLAAASSPVILS